MRKLLMRQVEFDQRTDGIKQKEIFRRITLHDYLVLSEGDDFFFLKSQDFAEDVLIVFG